MILWPRPCPSSAVMTADRPVVGVRYCGGCNPRYDRVAAVERLRARFPNLKFCPAAPGQDLILVVCGCTAQCAGTSDLDGELLFLCRPEDFQAAARRLTER